VENSIKRSILFGKKSKGGTSNLNNCKNPNCNDDKFVIEDFQNQDQGEEANNNLVVRMDKNRRISNFFFFFNYFFRYWIRF